MDQSPLLMREEALVENHRPNQIDFCIPMGPSQPGQQIRPTCAKSKGCERHKAAYDQAKADPNVGRVDKMVGVGELGRKERSALTVARVQRRQEPDSAKELWRRKCLTAQNS